MPFRKKNKRKGQQPADANGESLSLSGLSLTKTQQCSSSTRFGEQKGNRRRPSYAFNERKLSAGDKSGRFSESSKRKDAGSPDLKDEVDIETLRHTSTAGATSQIPISFSDVENGGTEYNSKNYCQESLLEKMKCNGAQASSKASVSRISNVSDELHGDSCLEHPTLVESYDRIPLLEITKLPRGGVSVQTEAVGRIQYGIPPETIKDSMRMGLTVPSIYIVPVERFCRELGPALGVNLAEFEFPAYFNFFILNKRCTLIVDSFHAEHNIRRVFSETLLGPSQFRKEGDEGITYEEEDFSPEFPRSAIPDFKKELKHFRFFDGKEMVLDTLLNFHYFEAPYDQSEGHNHIGVPPALSKHSSLDNSDNTDIEYVPDAAIASDDVQACGGKKSELSDHEHVLELSNSMSSSKKAKTLAYAQVKLAGEVAVVYPTNTTPEQRESKSCKRVEIFKMPGGTEYVIHDVDENNVIVGKVRFSGNVRVSESMSVAGFGGRSMGMFQSSEDAEMGETKESNDNDCDGKDSSSLSENILPPTFHPPSFGVTVLGNSHGFDKSGSVSGYVLWINGRGVMIDPPPYSSKTLELEGIRPRLIVGIILTHCHADHDAGAFQKLLGGSPVVVITTPTIYKSFIRKYAALSNLSPALLRHCHRHKPAIIGAPLRFQGATFHFTYTLHSIPCVGFRVEWRGRSMVFTGDHFNSPEAITKLQESGVLSVARAKDLMNLPLQETDLLLHESGQPPIHTPLDVLLKLPQRVKDRLYVVHTSALPPDCELRVAPTGTEGTIRLDKDIPLNYDLGYQSSRTRFSLVGLPETTSFSDEAGIQSMWSSSEYDSFESQKMITLGSKLKMEKGTMTSSLIQESLREPPRVALRPTSSTDAWFILNLLSAVPFLSDLSYSSTMEVLETARVDAFCINDVIVPASRRKEVLCVVWEGTCMERENNDDSDVVCRNSTFRRVSTFQVNQGAHKPINAKEVKKKNRQAVWFAGDWTGPRSLQPEKIFSGESSLSETHDIVAMSQEGVKVITIEFANLHKILKNGSALYRKYLFRKTRSTNARNTNHLQIRELSEKNTQGGLNNPSVIEILECNSTLRKLTAVQKRHLESLAEGPVQYPPGEKLWCAGTVVDKAFVIISGTAHFLPMRRNAGSSVHVKRENGSSFDFPSSIGDSMRADAAKVAEFDKEDDCSGCSHASANANQNKKILQNDFEKSSSLGNNDLSASHNYAKLTHELQARAESMNLSAPANKCSFQRYSSSTEASGSVHSFNDIDSVNSVDDDYDDDPLFNNVGGKRNKKITDMMRKRSAKDRFANKVLGSFYCRRSFTAGLVFSKGHFLGDIFKMVSGSISSVNSSDTDMIHPSAELTMSLDAGNDIDANSFKSSIGEMIIPEQQEDRNIRHSSTLTAGKEGCVVLVLTNTNLIPFLENNPGILLSLLGTQVVL